MATAQDLAAQLDRLAACDTGTSPVVSLYLNMQPDGRGRDHFAPFVRKELTDRIETYGAQGPERQSLTRDAERIREYLDGISPSVNGLALFACSAAKLFEPVPLVAPIHEHRLYISTQPHLYPLARVLGAHPRYAVLLADTRSARLFVVAAHAVERSVQVEGVKTRRHKMGGWSQARYQRHVDNYHAQHAKEAVEVLTRVVHAESVEAIVIAGDEVIVPLLKEQLSKDLAARVVDVLKLDIRAPEREILQATLEALREKDAASDRERVDALLDAYRANGLAVVGVEETSRALVRGQVDEVLITTVPHIIDAGNGPAVPAAGAPDATAPTPEERVADDLVVKARQTAASLRFIEDPALLAAVGGVGAFLRFRL
jgi:peptide chain release factor subunit 1